MSADIHTGAVGGRVATSAAEPRALAHPSGEQAVVPREPMLTWAADSSIMPAVETRPRLRQMLGVCVWAAVLGLGGLVVGFRGLLAAMLNETPSWYVPMMLGIGAIGIGLTAAAFMSVHRRRTPYILLGAGTIALAYSIFVTVQTL